MIYMSRDCPGNVDQVASTRQERSYWWPWKPEDVPLCAVGTAQASSPKGQPRLPRISLAIQPPL